MRNLSNLVDSECAEEALAAEPFKLAFGGRHGLPCLESALVTVVRPAAGLALRNLKTAV